MSRFVVIGPRGTQTHDDWFIDALSEAYSGRDDHVTLFAKLGLRIQALEEVLEHWRDPAPEQDVTRSVAVYRERESVDKNLALFNYNVLPLVPHLFPVIDAVAVFGTMYEVPTGFVLDFFPRIISPCRTLAFAQCADKDLKVLYDAASRVFSSRRFIDVESTLSDARRESLDLRPYGGAHVKKAYASRGTMVFSRAATRNAAVQQFVQSCEAYTAFQPETYALSHYNFKINFSPRDGDKKFKAGMDSLNKRAENIFRRKLQKSF